MEQNVDTGVPVVPMAENKQKSGNGLIIVTAIVCVLAFCGIGFGVYEMMQSSDKDKQIANLQSQNKENSEAIDNESDISDTNKVDGGPYIAGEYFYVPEWELKFKIPEDLSNYGYSVNYALARGEGNIDTNSPQIGFTAMLKSDITYNAQDWTYDTIETCAIVSVSKEKPGWDDHNINGIIKDFDDYTLLIWNYSRHGSCDLNLHIDEVQEKIQTMFSNPEEI